MKFSFILIPFLFTLSLSSFNKGCTSAKKDTDTLTTSIIKRKSVFNPEYFKDETIFHYLLKVKYQDGLYNLADPSLYKVTGEYRDTSVSGTMIINFLNATNGTISSITGNPPYKFIKENFSRLKDTLNFINLNSIEFTLAIPANNNIKKVQFNENNIAGSIIAIPTDTINLINLNKTAALDSTLF